MAQIEKLFSSVLKNEVVRFLVVGSMAAGLHFVVVLFLVQSRGWQPLTANIVAFLAAFQVSYTGHRFWTFSNTALKHQQSLPRFMGVAAFSFFTNEFLYFLLLRFTALPYWLALGIVLVMVAVITFIASKFWAFSQ